MSEVDFSPSLSERLNTALDATTLRMLRASSAFGLTCAVIVFIPTLASGSELDVAVAGVWTVVWAIAVAKPESSRRVLDEHLNAFIASLAVFSLTTVIATGGIASPTIIDVNWSVWLIAIVAGWRATLISGVAIACSHALAFSVSGIHGSSSGQGDLYFALTQILNPIVVAAVALALLGTFRRTLEGAAVTTSRWRATKAGFEPLRQLPSNDSGEPSAPGVAVSRSTLTPSEEQIVADLAAGLTPQQIAARTHRSVATIYDHIANAKRRVGARTTTHLVGLTWRPR